MKNGIKSKHNKIWTQLSRKSDEEDKLNKLKEIISKHQVFSDGERSDFRLLDQMYPGSKFILNTRNLKDWIESRIRWVYRFGINKPPKSNDLLGQGYLPDRKKEIKTWVRRRNNYYLDVFEYFANRPQDLLIINVVNDVDEVWQNNLINFLEKIKLKPIKLLIHQINASNFNTNQDFLDQRYQEIVECFEELNISREQWNHNSIVNIKTKC